MEESKINAHAYTILIDHDGSGQFGGGFFFQSHLARGGEINNYGKLEQQVSGTGEMRETGLSNQYEAPICTSYGLLLSTYHFT